MLVEIRQSDSVLGVAVVKESMDSREIGLLFKSMAEGDTENWDHKDCMNPKAEDKAGVVVWLNDSDMLLDIAVQLKFAADQMKEAEKANDPTTTN